MLIVIAATCAAFPPVVSAHDDHPLPLTAHSMDEAMAMAESEGALILVDFYSPT